MDDDNDNNGLNSLCRESKVFDAMKEWVAFDLAQPPAVEEGHILRVTDAIDWTRKRRIERDDIKDYLAVAMGLKAEDSQAAEAIGTAAFRARISIERFNALADAALDEFYENARLPKSLLQESNMTGYIEGAEKGVDQAADVLDFFTEMQSQDSKRLNKPNLFVCIIAPSGTGKTQLAATSSLSYDNSKAATIYLNMSPGDSYQAFYKPHVSLQGIMMFKEGLKTFFDEIKKRIPSSNLTADTIGSWAKSNDNGHSPFVRMLYHLLSGKPFLGEKCHPCMTLSSVKKEIEGKRYHFFLDEVPHVGDSDFLKVLCLRDTLRYLGIAPILMSTHTGAQDHIGNPSRSTSDAWTWVVSKLPRYSPWSRNTTPLLIKTERPLVHYHVRKDPGSLQHIIEGLRSMLQSSKPYPWSGDPALQLVQLFCTDVDINGRTFSSSHNLVGHHFGCLQQASENGRLSYNFLDSHQFVNRLSVAPVSAVKEPLLYLTLVTWDETMLWGDKQAKPKIKFPLVDEGGHPLTVRTAFDQCSSNFTAMASTENVHAEEANGNLMEVLVHASLILASMKTSPNTESYLPGVGLNEFLPLIQKLMLPGLLEKVPPTPDIFNQISYDWFNVPALGGSNSRLPREFSTAIGVNLGFLERPKDNAMVDGMIRYQIYGDGTPEPEKHPFISIECKNYNVGIGAKELKQIFLRIKRGIKCSLIFASSIASGTFAATDLENLKEVCFARNHAPDSVSVVDWRMDKAPTFLRVKGKQFKAPETTKTSLLVVIISVGVVDATFERKRKRVSPSYTNKCMRDRMRVELGSRLKSNVKK